MADIITLQQLRDASVDADALERILNDAEWVEIETRLGRKVFSISTINALISKLNNDASVAIDELQDAIDVAVAAGVGASGWLANLVLDASGKTQQDINNNQFRLNNLRVSVLDDDSVKGDGLTDESQALQAIARKMDDDKQPYIFFPFHHNNYLLKSPVAIQEPTGIIGDKPPTYNRGRGKAGWILVHNDADYALNLGNSRTYDPAVTNVDLKKSSNPADTWMIKGIGIRQHSSVSSPRVKDGIWFTTNNNGPDRSVNFIEVSAVGLNRAIYVPNQTAAVTTASFTVKDCNLVNNNYAIYHRARTYGALIANNQLEQNSLGGIHICADGLITIRDNMLEGQRNAINIMNHDVLLNTGRTSITGNYFEANYGDYAIQYEGTTGSTLSLKNNFSLNLVTKDYCLIKQGTRTLLENDEQSFVTLQSEVFLDINSKLTSNRDYGFYYRKTLATDDNVIVRHFSEVLQTPNTFDGFVSLLPSNTKTIAKFNNTLCYTISDNSLIFNSATIAAGDLLEIHTLMYCESTPPSGMSAYIMDGANAVASFSPTVRSGSWITSTNVVTAKRSAPNTYAYADINSRGAQYGLRLAGMIIKNHGQKALDDRVFIQPLNPKISVISGKAALNTPYSGFSLAAGATTAYTFRAVNTPEGQAVAVGDIARVSLMTDMHGLEVFSDIPISGQVRVWFKNPTAATITIPETTLKIIVL